MGEKYIKIFMDVFSVSKEEAIKTTRKEAEEWDSVGHMALISAIENEFEIELSADDIMNLNSYDDGIIILQRHGINVRGS